MRIIVSILLILLEYMGYAQNAPMRFKMLENGILHRIDLTGLFFTHDGKMWFGTSTGLASYNGNDFTVYPSREGKENIIPQRILAFTEDLHNNIWIFTPSRFLIRFNLATASYERVDFTKGFDIPENDVMVNSLYVDSQDKLWIGLLKYGFFIYDLKTGKAEHHNVSEDHPGIIWSDKYQNSVRFIKEDPSDGNTVWLAAYGAGLIRYNRKSGKTQKNFKAFYVKDSVVQNN